MKRYKYNGIRAWRKALDRDSGMRVCWHEFAQTVGQLRTKNEKEMAGVNVAGIWRSLDPSLTGWLTLDQFDPHGYSVLASFTRWAKQAHGSIAKAFKALLPGAAAERGLGRGKLFRALQGSLQLSEEDFDVLFDGLNLDDGGDRVHPEELRFLERWDPDAEMEERARWEEHFGPGNKRASVQMMQGASASCSPAKNFADAATPRDYDLCETDEEDNRALDRFGLMG